MARVRVESVVRPLVSALVAGIGAAAGFTHTHEAAFRAGQAGWLSWADAVVIECMVIVAGFEAARAKRNGRSLVFPLAVLVIAFLVQMGAQVSGAPHNFAGWLFAAVPALGCLVIVKLAMHGGDHGDQSAVAPAKRPEVQPQPVTSTRLDMPDEVPAIEPPAPKPAPKQAVSWLSQ